MRKILVCAAVCALATCSPAVGADSTKATKEAAPAAVQLKTETAKLSYSFGIEMATYLKRLDADIDVEALVRGMRDGVTGAKSALTAEEMAKVKRAFQLRMQSKMAAKAKTDSDKNKKEADAFFAANGKKKGVVTTASGLQYQVLKAGDGAQPKATDKVKVHYRGTFADGKEFDSSYKRGQPVTFPINGVIKGWGEGVQLMKVGSKHRLFVPGELGYGAQGRPPVIGPNQMLIFEVELLSIEK